jgi:hypothetical protein
LAQKRPLLAKQKTDAFKANGVFLNKESDRNCDIDLWHRSLDLLWMNAQKLVSE